MAADRTSEHRLTPSDPVGSIDPDEVGHKIFETTFRGFDPGEVQAHLIAVGSELRTFRDRTVDLELRLAEAERVAEQASVIDDERLTAALGDEVATILEAARSAASKLRARAEIDAAASARAGDEQAARVRREADGLLELRTAEAQQAVVAIEQEGEARRAQAALDAAAEVEAGRQAGREMVAEAQIVRERILKDLARRRRQARQQIEQLRAGRERLLDAYRVVRETMERATEELEISLPAAKAAAETAGRTLATADEDLSVEQLEGMLDAARDAGLIDARLSELDGASSDIEVSATGDDPESSPTGADIEEVAATDDSADATGSGPSAPPGRSHRRGRRAERIVADESAPAPIEGRRSSSVRVFRRDGDPSTDESESPADQPVASAGVDRTDEADAVDEEIVIEVVEEIIEVDELADGEAEVVVIEEVVEVIVEPEGAADPVEGEVITGLFARIRADHAEPSTPDSPVVAEGTTGRRTKGKGRGNGNGKGNGATNGNGRSRSAPADARPSRRPGGDAGSGPGAEVVDGPDDADASPQHRRDLALAGPSRGLGRALKRVVADEQNQVLDVVRRQKKTPDLDAVLPESSEHALRYAAAARSELADAAYAGATFADEGTSQRPDIDDLAAELSLAIVGQLRARFASALASAPDDRDALLDVLRSAYRDSKGQRVDECVHHFAGEAFNRGVRAASSSGLDVRMLVESGSKPSLT